MDYFFEYIQYDSAYFIYPLIINDKRIIFKFYILLKSISLIFYIISLSNCNNIFFIFFIFCMFLSTINRIIYEYTINGKIFYNEQDFKIWQKSNFSLSRLLFSFIELLIKLVYFINIYSTLITFNNFCDIGESIFKIHTIIIFSIYLFLLVIYMLLFSTIYLNNIKSINNSNRTSFILPLYTQNEECCICMDLEIIQPWSITECSHKFHSVCISQKVIYNKSCPICRHKLR